MPSAKVKQADKEFFLTRQQMAAILSVRPEHFDKTYRPLVPADLVVKQGRRVYFKPEANRAILNHLVQKAEQVQQAADGDPLMVGGDGDEGLERYRLAKAEHAELDLAERKGELVEVAALSDLIGVLGSHIRTATSRLQTEHGEEAAGIIDGALDAAEHEIGDRFGSSDQAT